MKFMNRWKRVKKQWSPGWTSALNLYHVNILHIIMEPPPMVPCQQLGIHGLMRVCAIPSTLNYWNHDSLDYATCCRFSNIQLVLPQAQVRHYIWCWVVNRATVVDLLPYLMETDMMDMHLVPFCMKCGCHFIQCQLSVTANSFH